MLLCFYDVMLLYCYAVMMLCYYAVTDTLSYLALAVKIKGSGLKQRHLVFQYTM